MLTKGAGSYATVLAAAAPTPLYDSLAAAWLVNETSGIRADSIGSEDLADNNTVGSNTGLVYADAAEFISANTEYLSRASSAAAQIGDIPFWASLWVRPDSVTGDRSLFSKISSGSDREYDLKFEGSARFRWYVTATASLWDSSVSKNLTIAVDTWYWIIIWHDPDANTINMQVNDLSVVSVAYSSGIRAATNVFNLGAWGNGNGHLDGRIGGPVCIGKDYIPTADDRTWMYNAGSGRTLAEMQVYTG